MDPTTAFCPNRVCPARGQTGKGNMGVHARKDKRWRCRVCGQTFVERKGTAFYRLRTPGERMTLVVTLMAHGCPLQAVVAAFGFDERTVADWLARAGQQSRAVHEHLVEQPRDLGQVQADELRVNAELQQITHIISRDLKEPLRTVGNFAGVLAKRYQGELDTTAEEYVALAGDGAKRMHQMIEGLLAYTQAGGQTQEFTVVDCEALLARILGGLQLVVMESDAEVTHDPLPTVRSDTTR
jgi:signal transduction histidine kinase